MGYFRKKMSRNASRRNFRRSAGTSKVNTRSSSMRGGIRM